MSSIQNGDTILVVRTLINGHFEDGIVSRVATIQELVGLQVTHRAHGSIVVVSGYNAAGDGGGGTFYWHKTSTDFSDGISVFVPTALQSSEQTFSTGIYLLRSDRLPERTVGHTGVIFGSVKFFYSGGTGTKPSSSFITDHELHGHALAFSTDTSSDVIPHQPFFEHATGTIKHDGEYGANVGAQKLLKLCLAHNAADTDNFTVRYKYATGAGRWIRISDGEVTPAMIGCIPDDDTKNNADLLAWLFNYAANTGVAILIDAFYYYKGTLEIPNGLRVVQRKPKDSAGLKVCPWSTIPAIDHLADDYDDTIPAAKLDKDTCCIIAGDNIENFGLSGVLIDGNVYENDDFLTDASYDTDPSGSVSQALRESPTYGGLIILAQSNRRINANLRVDLENIRIGEFGGSCLIAATNQRIFSARNVELGVSVSGRVKYGGSGDWHGLWLYGYSRTAVERSYNQVSHGHRYTWNRPDGTTPTRLWSANAVPANLGTSFAYPHDRTTDLPPGATYSGVDWDFTGSDFTSGFSIRGTGVRLSGRMQTPASSSEFIALHSLYSAAEGDYQVDVDLAVYNASSVGVTPLGNNGGGWHTGSRVKMRIHDIYDDTGTPTQVVPSLPALPSAKGPVVYVGKLPADHNGEATVLRQDITLDIFSELAHKELIDLDGIAGLGQTVTASDYMPTTVRLSGQILNASNKLFFGANGQGPAAGLSAIPVRVLCDGLIFRVFDPSTLYVGDAPLLDNAFEVIKLRQCSTPEGWVSEQSGTIDIVGSDLSSFTCDISTNLLWRPKQLMVTPISADAGSYFSHATIVTTGAGDTENAIQPTIRLHFSGSTPAGAAIEMIWSAAVSPF